MTQAQTAPGLGVGVVQGVGDRAGVGEQVLGAQVRAVQLDSSLHTSLCG